MEQQRKREDIEEQYKWDLSTIFKSLDDFNKEYALVKEEIKKIGSFKGRITRSAEDLLEYCTFSDFLERRLYKLYYYAHLNFDSDTTNIKYQELKGKVDSLLTDYSSADSFSRPEILNSDKDKVMEFINNTSELLKYKHNFDSIFRYQDHKLSEEEERIISTLGTVIGSPEDIYESLTDSDLKFGTIIDENGKEIEFTESNWSIISRSKDRRVRMDGFKLLYKTYSKFKNTIANTFSKNVEYLTKMAKLKNFNSSIEASLYSDAVEVEVYNNLINTVNDNLDVLYKYYKMKKEILGLDELHLYDIYVELVEGYNKKYDFEEAKDLVFKALEPLGEDYLSILKRAFDERWIDIYNNEGKRGGAYSSGFYDTNPFVLLNYEGSFEDVSTLAHELGHSMHTYLSCKNNDYCNSNYQIFVAEVASTVNELLLREYILQNSQDEEEKKYVLNSLLELFKATIFRQVMFAEFERDIHAAHEAGEVLTNEYLCSKYYELNKKYFGNDVYVDDEIKYEWERIPHFYYDFYVYKYAIGLSCACYIVKNILSGVDKNAENYKKFLSSGGSDYPVNELKICGIDITSSEVIDSAIEMFNETIEQFKALRK